jgi:SAM-dependent methyltransferase
MRADLFELHAELEDTHWWFVARRRVMQRLVRRVLPPSPSAIVVDVGCGTGANIASMRDWYRCVGIDTTPRAIEIARRRFPSLEWITGPAPGALGATARHADMFLSMDVLEHVDDVAMFRGLFAVAKVGALFYINVPADMALWSQHDVSFGHLRRYDAARLRALWSDLPASTLLLSHFNARLYPIVRVVRTLANLRGGSFGRGGTDLRQPPGPLNRALTGIFAGEGARLERVLDGTATPYAFGSSLVAVVRKEGG